MLQLLLETVVKTAADHDKDTFFIGNKNSIKTKKPAMITLNTSKTLSHLCTCLLTVVTKQFEIWLRWCLHWRLTHRFQQTGIALFDLVSVIFPA